MNELQAMGTRKFNLFDTHLQMMNKDAFDHIAFRNMMALFISSCWFYFAKFVLFLVKFVGQHIFRSKEDDSSQKDIKDYLAPPQAVLESNEIEEEKREPSSFSFKFEYQVPEVNSVVIKEEESFQARTMSISNYSFLSKQNTCGFIEEPEVATFQVHESFIGCSDDEELEPELLSAGEFVQPCLKSDDVKSLEDQELERIFSSDSVRDFSKLSVQSEKLEVRNPNVSYSCSLDEKEVIDSSSSFDSDSVGNSEKPGIQSEDIMFLNDQNEGLYIFHGFNSDDVGEFEETVMHSDTNFDSDTDSISDDYSVKDLMVDSDSDDLLSEMDFGDKESFIASSTFEMELVKDMEKTEEGQSSNCENVLSDKLEAELELKELSDRVIDELPSSSKVQIEFMDSSDDELQHSENYNNIPAACSKLTEPDPEPEPVHADFDNSNARLGQMEEIPECAKNTSEEKSEETKLKDVDDEELDELESLWEHQDLIEQLKMELKRVRAGGLPTIFEESESPKTIEDLKPWKIDEKFLRGDPMDELHKFYKSYRERMRKFDILNYQKMYAIGFLQLKDPLQSMGNQKPLIPTILSHFSQNLKPLYRRKSSSDPSEKFMKELQVELETVYVGQTCLSWEFLRWQYEKARELPDSDPYWSHRYNQVAGEFQQFQVLLQRFIENESFQGPRLQNYVKNRCVLRNLLQVPVIKEDCSKNKMEEKMKGNYAITSEMLEEIMEESIRIFWEFVKADKDETSIILKGLIGNQVELQDQSDFQLMSEIQTSLQKKEKKLKDILKTGNCIVKKFKKPRENRSNQDMFFSQVDMKLVARVLKMSRITTDQLSWCHMKLSKITFSDRKIHREQSFLLFPC